MDRVHAYRGEGWYPHSYTKYHRRMRTSSSWCTCGKSVRFPAFQPLTIVKSEKSLVTSREDFFFSRDFPFTSILPANPVTHGCTERAGNCLVWSYGGGEGRCSEIPPPSLAPKYFGVNDLSWWAVRSPAGLIRKFPRAEGGPLPRFEFENVASEIEGLRWVKYSVKRSFHCQIDY